MKYDNRDTYKPGWKFAEYEKKGVPVRIAVGARDLENNTVEVARRDSREKSTVSMDGLADRVIALLSEIHQAIYDKAKKYQQEHITEVNSWEEFKEVLKTKTGFLSAHWDGTPETEEKI